MLLTLGMHACSEGYCSCPVCVYGRRQKKVPISRPYNGTGNPVPFPFRSRAVAVLVRFQTVPVLSHGQPVRSGERPVRRN